MVTVVVNVVTVVTLANAVGNGNQCFNVVGNVVSVTKEGSLEEGISGGAWRLVVVAVARPWQWAQHSAGHYQGQAVLQGGRCSQVMQY